MLVGMYIFELIYRVKVSHISSMHHLGTILVAESTVAISLDLTREPDASIEFILITVWGKSLLPEDDSHYVNTDLVIRDTGAFDIVSELLPHIAIILYRLHPTRHKYLQRLFLFASCSTFIGTVCETVVIFYFFGSVWQRWQLAFKIVTPILHCAFSATQLHGSRIFYRMWRRQRRFVEEEIVRERESGYAGVDAVAGSEEAVGSPEGLFNEPREQKRGDAV